MREAKEQTPSVPALCPTSCTLLCSLISFFPAQISRQQTLHGVNLGLCRAWLTWKSALGLNHLQASCGATGHGRDGIKRSEVPRWPRLCAEGSL